MRRDNTEELLDALKDSLQGLDALRHVPHNDIHVLNLKQHLREKIAEMEGRAIYALRAA